MSRRRPPRAGSRPSGPSLIDEEEATPEGARRMAEARRSLSSPAVVEAAVGAAVAAASVWLWARLLGVRGA